MSLTVLPRFLIFKRRCVSFKEIRKLCLNHGIVNNTTREKPHTPVMVNEVVNYLNLKKGNVLVDMTFGAGGHSSVLLERVPDLKVIALDRDPVAQEFMKELKENYPNQVIPLLGKFSDLPVLLKEKGIEPNSIDGFLFDLGCSSMQFDCAERGFSIIKDGPLDMRMDGTRIPNQVTAADVIAHASELELSKIFKVYGDEKRARKIANALVTARYNFKAIKTTGELNNIIETVCCNEIRYDKLQRETRTATKVFQALRVFVNDEINQLYCGINIAHRYLKVNGRAVVISFHSVEDKVAKLAFLNRDVGGCPKISPPYLYDQTKNFASKELVSFFKKNWAALNRSVVLPSEVEVLANARSRSAKLRAAAKILNEEKDC